MSETVLHTTFKRVPIDRETLKSIGYRAESAYRLYDKIFGPDPSLVVKKTVPGTLEATSWLADVPLCSAALLRLFLNPSLPVTIDKKHRIFLVEPEKIGFEEFWQGQCHLMCHTKRGSVVAFVFLGHWVVRRIMDKALSRPMVVPLNWMAIPWNPDGDRPITLIHPTLALKLREQPRPKYSFRDFVHRTLEERGLTGIAEKVLRFPTWRREPKNTVMLIRCERSDEGVRLSSQSGFMSYPCMFHIINNHQVLIEPLP
ncbi:hypothetical protein GGR51DRAFT_573662 [Nemania sp. FL0031]|nr:hypothetical protein GGR51DRAFT_573662 [Nemania sp. FL0031]